MSAPAVSLAAATRLLRFVREEPRNSNKGQAVEAMLASVGLPPGQPWCAAFIAYVGRTLYGDAWPLPMTGGCAALGDAAATKGMIRTMPEAGDVFLVWFPSLGRFAHTGFVLEVRGGQCWTVEGNTNGGGSRDGWGVFERWRTFGPQDRFIRWHGEG